MTFTNPPHRWSWIFGFNVLTRCKIENCIRHGSERIRRMIREEM